MGGVGVNGGTKFIPSSQAFWVRAIAASPSVSLTEATKSTTDQAYMRTSSADSSQTQLPIDLLSLTMFNASAADQTIIRFDPAATDSFDVNYDALKLSSMDTTVPYLASVMDTTDDYSINALPPVTSDIVIPLRAKAGVTGMYTIRRDSISHLPHSMCITLEDLLTGSLAPLPQGASYSFSISDTTSAPRFLLHFGPSLTTGAFPSTCAGSADGKAFAHGTGNGPWDYTWKDAAGNVIAVHNNISGTDSLFHIAAGNYVVEVNGNDGYCSLRSDTITVDGPVPLDVQDSITPATCAYTSDAAIYVNQVTGGTAPYSLSWPDGSTADSLANIPPGNYPLLVTDGNHCVDTITMAVTTSSTLSSSFTATPDTVVLQSLVSFSNYSSGANSYTWDFGDGSPVSSTANPLYAYSGSGTMTVTLISSDGICEDTSTQTVYVIDNTSVQQLGANGNVGITAGQQSIGVLFNLPAQAHARIRVYDAGGRLVADEETYVGNGKIDIPLTGDASEMYSVFVVLPDKIYSGKVVLLHR